jgi:hypothetical protein
MGYGCCRFARWILCGVVGIGNKLNEIFLRFG